jgi:hypothetical protein
MRPEVRCHEISFSPDPVLLHAQVVRQPLFNALGEVMGDERARRFGEERRWALCGPASIALTRIINNRTGVPISRESSGKRLELCIALFDPGDPQKKIDHTYIRYYTGVKDFLEREIVYSIDPIHEPLFGGKGEHGRIIVERHTTDTIDADLARKYHLFPPQHDSEYFLTSPSFVEDPSDPSSRQILPDLLAAFHDERITQPRFRGNSGKIYNYGVWSLQIAQVIKKIEPRWRRIISF